MKRITTLLICLLLIGGANALRANDKFVVVIDAGHGGKDGGATRGKYLEKTINLGVALALGKLIETNNKDVKVVYTRKTDVFVALDKRADIANKAKANLFISVHTNSTAATTTTATGADTYILGLSSSKESLAVAKRENSVILQEEDYTTKYQGFDPNSTESYIIFEFMTNKYLDQSLEVASYIQSGFKTVAKRKDRGVRQDIFLVLRQSSMPSVLIELGFINNATEAAYLSSADGQSAMAKSIYFGFNKYKANFDKMQGNHTDSAPAANTNLTSTSTSPKSSTSTGMIEAISPNSTPKNQIEYRLQFLISKNKLATNSTLLKGLTGVNYYQDGGMYKYTYGASTDQNEILRMKKKIVTKFSDCFVVKFKNGVRIP